MAEVAAESALSVVRLSEGQKAILRELLRRNVFEPDGTAITSTETMLSDRHNVWIHWRTAEALERRGLVEQHCDGRFYDEGCDVTLTNKGAELARRFDD